MPLFSPIRIGNVTIRNRIVKSAMAEGRAERDGRPKPELIRLYERWSKGGIGLLITGMAHVKPGYAFTDQELGLYEDELIGPLRTLTSAVHQQGACIFAQLCHAPPQLPRQKAQSLGAIAPSSGFCQTNLLWNRAITHRELVDLAHDFGAATWRAQQAGFDGVQLHAAHGYLLSRMLSPRDNRRSDVWGGDFEGRLRFLRAVYRAMRDAVGDDFPITIKLNAHDGLSNGLDLDSALRIGRCLESWGMNAIEVSAGIADVGFGCYPNKGGIPRDVGKRFLRQEFPFLKPVIAMMGPVLKLAEHQVRLRQEAYFYPLARRFAEELNLPIMCVGGVRSLSVAERIVRESRVAMVSLARPLVRQPFLPRDWERRTNERAQCTSCNTCFVQLGLGEPLRCWQKTRNDP